MKTLKHTHRKLIAMSLVITVLLGISLLWSGSARAATLPAETCTYDGLTNTRTCELWATTGTLALPGGATVPFWGYASSDPLLGGLAELPGPAIIANQGEIVQVILHNTLTEATALYFSGQDLIPDLTGVAAGGQTTYSFTATQPGTFTYEAGLLGTNQYQVAMGMYGALVVRPAGLPGQAYTDPATAFIDEALVLLEQEAAASPDYPKARLALGVALSRLGEKARSLEEFRAAVGLDPGNFDARSALGLALVASGDLPGAIEHLGEAVRLKPGDTATEFNLANALQQSGRPGEAVPHYEAALRSRPDYVEALSNLALALAASGDPAGGIERLARAARLRPDSAALQVNLAEYNLRGTSRVQLQGRG